MNGKILVVDDSKTDRIMIESMLGDYQVITASDGVEALEKIGEHPDIDLMILDLNMPRMDGFQLLTKLKEEEAIPSIRTIVLTNYDELENEIRGLKLGAVDYLRKPVQMDSLRVRIDIHMELLRIQKMFEEKLYDQNLTFDTIFQQAPIGIAISYGAQPHSGGMEELISINPMYEKITGRTRKELLQLGWLKITHPEDIEKDLQLLEKMQNGEIPYYAMDKRYLRPDGSVVWVSMITAPLYLSNHLQFSHVTLIQDITSRKEMEDHLRYSSEHDEWTGLYNRRFFETVLLDDQQNSHSEKRALVLVNLSEVHSLNMTYGFSYGQEFVRKIAGLLEDFTSSEHLLFKTYDNRFSFYLRNYKTWDEVMVFARDIAEVLDPYMRSERINAGIGVLEIPGGNGEELEKHLKNLLVTSEKALFREEATVGICVFDENLENEIRREEEIIRELTWISQGEREGGLSLEYQPILDLVSNQITGFEALARLDCTTLGRVSPLEFIPIAEKTKLIIPVGELIMEKAFRFQNKLKSLGYDHLMISINVSPIQLLTKDFNLRTREMMKNTGVNPEYVGLEVTENVFTDNYQDINRTLGDLNQLGITTAIDDFGTGYSSFARGRELHINCFKIDKIFIDKILSLKEEEAITEDVIRIAHRLGQMVIAEGVEHEIQLDYLRKSLCDKVQGFLISKPLVEEEAIGFLKK
ncbi:MAG: EAL domain-containing protein [Clostridia bacterium]|nr:EAL domain-containing protein [Clostridia bacterium]